MESNKKTLTVFTPTYNRSDTLRRTYESLCNQTCQDFEWLIIDDGSTDNTEDVVKTWVNERKIPLRYIKKENGGLFTGYNTAIANIDTELNVCVDSDDFMPNDAVEIIVNEWSKIKDSNIAGIIGLDYYMSGGPIGGMFSDERNVHYWEKFYKVGHVCDSKIVCRTDLMKQIAPMPSFGEKDFNPTWFYKKIGEIYKFHLINKCLCIVEYQSDGMMAGIFRQYRNSPKSFAESRRMEMSSNFVPLKNKFRAAIHYISSSVFSKDWKFLSKSPQKLLTVAAIIPGLGLHTYILYQLLVQRNRTFKI